MTNYKKLTLADGGADVIFKIIIINDCFVVSFVLYII